MTITVTVTPALVVPTIVSGATVTVTATGTSVSSTSIGTAIALSVANIDDPSTELAAVAGTMAKGSLKLCYQTIAGVDQWRLYALDNASSTAAATPYRIDRSAGGQWVLLGGKGVNSDFTVGGQLKIADSDQSHAITFAPGNEAANRQITIPVLGGTVTMPFLELAQAWALLQTFANVAISAGTIAGVTVSATSVTDSGLTSGRVTFASTGGLLADSANFTWNGTTLAITGAGTYSTTLGVTGILTVTNNIAQTLSVNTGLQIGLTNSNGGTLAFNRVILSNGTNVAVLDHYGTAYTNSTNFGIATAGTTALLDNGAGMMIGTTAASPLYLGTNGAVALTISSAGNLALAAAKTITAPGGLIIGNETMDTYDEGVWTPVIFGDGTAGANTYSTQQGKYVKLGKIVVATFYITMSAKDAAMAGNILLGGLPFTATTTVNFGCTGNLVENITFGSYLGLNGSPSTTSMYLVKNNTGAASGICQHTDMTNTSQLRGTVTYIAV